MGIWKKIRLFEISGPAAPVKTAARFALAAVLFLLCSVSGFAATLNVPASYATIQAAVNAASNGDIVLVANGTYTGASNKNIDFVGKAITVRSANGAASCIIDCQNSGRGFYFHTNETSSSIVDGFTIQNGWLTQEGAYNEDGTLDLTVLGGGINCQSSPVIRNCIIKNCQAMGAGIFIGKEFSPSEAHPLIENCSIHDNDAYSSSAGLLNRGGGIFVWNAYPTISNCLIYNNTAGWRGAGIEFKSCGDAAHPFVVRNCVIYNNTTFVTDYELPAGGLICDEEVSYGTVSNCIIWNNQLMDFYAEPDAGDVYRVQISNSDVGVGYTAYGTNNIDQDPVFVGATDFRLSSSSPCIDAGNGSLAPATDILGNPRVDIASVANTGTGTPAYTDIGAYELQIGSPVANAGPDQVVHDLNLNGSEPVTLNGSGSSDPDGTITSYVWTEGAATIATGVAPTATLSTGTHTITLTVTDNDGGTAADTVSILVNIPPNANAGADQLVSDADRNGSESVALNGSLSTDTDGTITNYTWREGATSIATGMGPTVTLGAGTHAITLTVTDNNGATDTDNVTIRVDTPPIAASLLCDGKVNPNNASTYTPLFSWLFTDADAGDSQTAYQLRIGTAPGAGDVWDTAKTASAAASRVYGGGVVFTPNTTYFWGVQVWDEDNIGSGFASGTFVILDIGLRIFDGTETIKVAVDYAGGGYPLRIYRGGTTYGIVLVDPADPAASNIRIWTSSGTKAFKKM